ncbi:MCE family protein [Nocardia wallacei]|uniref:MCE family protein n=1 Tax=Nocardia wallacei TaxID=480035 RepID=UPI002453EC4D|nr:MCE family protein [Nocardia wallacei]
MKSKLVRAQLIIFAILAVLAVSNSVYNYMGLQRYTGIGMYTVTAELETAGGLYVNSLVTYRGVDIGTVTHLDVRPDKVAATLQLHSNRKVPRDTGAHVRSVSAVGEQYIDLVPATDGGPYLADGDVIQAARTTVPVPTAEVVKNVDTLLQTLPKDHLKTTVDELSAAFDGAGPELGRLIDSARPLIALAQADIGPTQRLIDDAEPVLAAVNGSHTEISSFAHNLASFTQQLAMSDAQLRTALDAGPGFFDTVGDTLTDLQSPVPLLLANLQSVGEVLRVNVAGLRHLLVVYPVLSASINYSAQGFQGADMTYGQIPLDIKLGDTANPLPCTEGYTATRRDPSDLSPAEPEANSYCKLTQSDARVVRGARNLPCATDPSVRTAEIANCPGGLPSTWPQMLSRPGAPYSPQPVPDNSSPGDPAPPADTGTSAADRAVPYDPGTGTFRAPDGSLYSIRPAHADKEDLTWQSLLMR